MNENQYLRAALAGLPGYTEAIELARQADAMSKELHAPQPVPSHLDPLTVGAITDEWIDATLAHAAAVAATGHRHAILTDLKQRASGAARTRLVQGVDALLAALHADLKLLLAEAAQSVAHFDGAATADAAIANDAGAHWKRLTELAADYDQLRDAQRQVMRNAPADIAVGARRSDGTGEDHASDLYLANLDEIWPDWRNPNYRRNVRIDGSVERLEPWPTDSTALLVWLVTSTAVPWVPTTKELDRLNVDRRAKANPMPKVVSGIRASLNNQSVAIIR